MSNITSKIIVASHPLRLSDKKLFAELIPYSGKWVNISDLPVHIAFDDLISWARKQSYNRITEINGKPFSGRSVISTWMHDPNERKFYIKLCSSLLD